MPELPDITVYVEQLRARVVDRPLEKIRLASPFLVRTVSPSVREAEGRTVRAIRRMGKRIVWNFDPPMHFVFHLMIAGRFRWRLRGDKLPGRLGLAAFDFPTGTLILTEAGTKRRASLHVVADEAGVRSLDPGGLEVMDTDESTFASALRRENHTLKRSMTDPHILSGIGNAYSDEILHRARLSPIRLTAAMTDEEIHRLFEATRSTLADWTEQLRKESGEAFPEKVTAFREGMAVHGRYREPCPVCGAPVQRIVHADNETNYCAKCQTGGKLLADRALSKLLKSDWPKTIEAMEARRGRA